MVGVTSPRPCGFELDAATAGFVAKAMSRFERDVRWVDGRMPAGWAPFHSWVSTGQGGSIGCEGLPSDTNSGDGEREPSLLVSIGTAAKLLDASESTVKRMIQNGTFRTVKVGALTKLRRADIEAFVAGGAP